MADVATTIKALTRRAQLICDSPNALRNENDYIQRVFHKSNYKPDFVKLNTQNELNKTNNLTTVTATVPYIKGTSEIISRILRLALQHTYSTQTHHNFTTYTNVKDKEQPHHRQGAVYKINCADCQATFIGETGRNVNMTNHIAEHHRQTKLTQHRLGLG